MGERFRDRREAGRRLAAELSGYDGRENTLVLGLPRGGVPVAFEVAGGLHLPLDVFVVRKLGVPGHEELAMGAVASGGVRVTNDDVVSLLGIANEEFEAICGREALEVDRREIAYRNHRPRLVVEGKTILLVDDGVATGSTMLAAVDALRKQRAARIVVAVPAMAPSSLPIFKRKADEVVAVITPDNFMAVGQWYEDFSQTSDEEVQGLLEKARPPRAA